VTRTGCRVRPGSVSATWLSRAGPLGPLAAVGTVGHTAVPDAADDQDAGRVTGVVAAHREADVREPDQRAERDIDHPDPAPLAAGAIRTLAPLALRRMCSADSRSVVSTTWPIGSGRRLHPPQLT